MDRFTQWPEVIPLKDIDTKSVARAYALGWVACFDVQEVMTSDRGSQCISGLWTSLSQLLGTQLIKTTAYHPQSNGFIERLHRTFVIDKKKTEHAVHTYSGVLDKRAAHFIFFGKFSLPTQA